VVHHLIVDGVSWRVLLEDLRVTYAALAHTSQVELPAKTSSFKRWTMALAEYAKSASLHQELPYWQRVVGNATGSAAGKGGERGFGSVRSSKSTGFELEPGETEQLRGPVLEATRASLEEVLLTALTLAYSAWSKRPSLLIELEGHGREDVFDGLDLTRSVGWFTSLFPVRLEAEGDSSATLARVKQALREVPRKGIGYGVLRYMTEYGPSLVPEEPPQLTFNYLGRLDGVLEGDRLLRPAAESVGSEHSPLGERPSRFEVNVLEQRGRLEVHWEYGSEHDDEGEVAALCANFARELRALMARALGRGSFEVSSSDFKHVHLADSDLSELFEDM
jgi:non-ribosomal peptide synthase protein (TIGR01720 family)